ncbi:hypothetical protein RvY_05636 [Ramazzottius varieornatus]|uniref:Biogenesis of lysosome-related organelles complex 1 subunit 6 n=1 Tax=Ramazzottius varieornatus TaxID=947166 RepID=A0A1D1UZB7_RAMVA|nr:hypothetical protein RvY_05636 [Ramazzottius varieornatus]
MFQMGPEADIGIDDICNISTLSLKPNSQSNISMSSVPGASEREEIVLRTDQDIGKLLCETLYAQSTVLSSIKEANWRFADSLDTFDLEEEARKASLYLQKLRSAREQMVQIRAQLRKLQDRSLRVRQAKDKQYEEAYQLWKSDLAYQKELVAKYEPAAKP